MKTVTLNETEITTSIDELKAELTYWENISDEELKENRTPKSYKIEMIGVYKGELEVLYHLRNLLDD